MGCDNFREDQRWGTFYGASAGWVASEEPWLKNKNINLLKLRASYGRAGQSTTGGGRYAYKIRMVPLPVTVLDIPVLTSTDLRKQWLVTPITNGNLRHAEYRVGFRLLE